MNVLLVGCCKNVANNINIIKKNFYDLSKYVNICKGVYYENNSDDNTAELLNLWQKNDNNIFCICEKYTDEELLNMCKAITWDNKPCRIEIIAMARNKILNEIEKELYNNISHVIMYDMDHKNLLPINKIVELLFNNINDYDAIICNGTDQDGDIYDTYSYRDYNYPYGPEIIGEDFGYFDILKQLEFKNKNGLVPVISAFNGLCIFKKSSIKNIRYSAHPSNELNNFYKNIIYNNDIFQKNKMDIIKFEEYINNNYNIKLLKPLHEIYDNIDITKSNIIKIHEGSLLGSHLFEKNGIFYKNCSGYNYPIVCEHVIFFLEMRAKGFNKIYIDKNFIWSSIWYDRLKYLSSIVPE
jgi:hypothetical protein